MRSCMPLGAAPRHTGTSRSVGVATALAFGPRGRLMCWGSNGVYEQPVRKTKLGGKVVAVKAVLLPRYFLDGACPSGTCPTENEVH